MKILYPKLILIAGILITLSVGFFMYRAYVSKPQVGVEAETRRKPILISGIEEPEEMRVEPFPVATLSEPERMLRDEMQAVKDNNDPNALLPGLNRILKAFPDYSDGYMMRVASLCRGQDRAAILSDIDNALKFADTSRVVAKDRRDLHAALLSIRAKLKYPASDNGSLEDLYRAVHADIKSATELFNSGGIKPEKTAGDICSWNETDMDTLVQRFPNDYRPYLFRGLYYSFFAFYDPPSIPRAERDFGKAAELNPNSALPHYFLASLWRGWSINRPLAERDKLFQRDLDELSKALALDPKLNAGFYKRALVNFDLKKFQEAVSDCDKIIEVDQKNVEAYELRAQSKMQLGNTLDAISDFGKAIQNKKRKLHDSDTHEHRGDAYMKAGQWELAIRDYTAAISLQTGGSVLLWSINDFRALYPEYKTVADDLIARKLNQTFYPDSKYEDFSRKFLHPEEGFHATPSFIIQEIYLKRADGYLRLGNWHKAAIEFRRAISGFPKLADTVERWRELAPQQNRRYFIDMKTFDDTYKESINLWIKEVRGANRDDGPYSLQQYALNCDARQIRTVSHLDYDASGRAIQRGKDRAWASVVPDTFGETLFNSACLSASR